MRAIGDLLKDHKIPGTELSELRRTAAGAASVFLKHKITAKQVSYKNSTLFFAIPSILKMELMLRQADLIRVLKDAGFAVGKIK